jgi:hypothetical protein
MGIPIGFLIAYPNPDVINVRLLYLVIKLCDGKNREKGLTGMVPLPKGRCEEIPDPSEVSTLGKLSVFLISYNLITRNSVNTDSAKHLLDICFF